LPVATYETLTKSTGAKHVQSVDWKRLSGGLHPVIREILGDNQKILGNKVYNRL